MSEDIIKNRDGGETKGTRTTQSYRAYHRNKEEEDLRIWGFFIFSIGATATALAVLQMRRSLNRFHSEQSFKGSRGRGFSGSRFQDEARRSYARLMEEEYEERMARVERIRRMRNLFNKEKIKHRRGYERWSEDSFAGYQHFQRDDWYWKTDSSYGNWSSYKGTTHTPTNSSLSHHYAVLGLSRSRITPYTDDEIKTAFRSKAKQYHPDQNQENKEVAEATFKEIMNSYEAIKSERRNDIK